MYFWQKLISIEVNIALLLDKYTIFYIWSLEAEYTGALLVECPATFQISGHETCLWGLYQDLMYWIIIRKRSSFNMGLVIKDARSDGRDIYI